MVGGRGGWNGYLRPTTTRKSSSSLPNALAAAQVYQPPSSACSVGSRRTPGCPSDIGSLLKYQLIVSLGLLVVQTRLRFPPISPQTVLLLVELITGADPEQVNNCYYSSLIIYKIALAVTLKIIVAEKHSWYPTAMQTYMGSVYTCPGADYKINIPTSRLA